MKKPGHFQAKNKKKNSRDVLSYEQLPLEEYEKKPEAHELRLDRKRVIIGVSIIVLLVLCVVVYFCRGSIASCVGIQTQPKEVSYAISGLDVEPGNFRTYSEGVGYVSDTDFVYMNEDGEKLHSVQIAYAQPMFRSDKTAGIIYDMGSTGYTLVSEESTLKSSNTQENIYLADVTSQLCYGFVTESSGYNARFEIYSAEHSLMYAYNFSEYYITSMALSPDGSGAVLCGVSTQQGKSVSAVYVLDFTKEEPLAKHIIEDEVIFDCDFISSQSVCAVGSASAFICKGRDFSEIVATSYDQMELTAYDFNADIGRLTLSLSRSGDGRNCTIRLVDTEGAVQRNIETDYEIISVSTIKDRITVTDGVSLYRYNDAGEFEVTHKLLSQCEQIRMYSANSVYILGLDKVVVCTF
ncbi:MAG: hypothetical protein IJV88_04315 [Ruminococcus sp.]|nr:hypothetical protein [Ruminococcus sp.]